MARPALQDMPAYVIDIGRSAAALMRGEMRLAKAEMSTIARSAGVGLVFAVLAALLALVALNLLASAAVAAIAETGMSLGLAALIVGGAALLIAAAFALAARARLNAQALTPSRTAENLRRDFTALKEAADVRS